MNTERLLRAKRSSFIINIIETPNGFSIVEGTEQLNKPEGLPPNPAQTQPPSTLHPHPAHPLPLKDYKPVFKKTSLIFLKRSDKSPEHADTAEEEAPVETPAFCRSFTQWFDLNKLHENEVTEVLSWYCDKTGANSEEAAEKEEFQNWLKLYRKHRNFIVRLYISEYAQTNKYLSASCIRKYLGCDGYWLMKLHLHLSNLGVINVQHYDYNLEMNSRRHIFKLRPDGRKELLSSELSTAVRQVHEEDQHELLKRLTSLIRPFCDYCRVHCGIVWFQHNRSLDPKEIANIMKNVNSKNPPLSQKEYEYILCVKCYCEANFPLLLTHQDFKKVTVNDKMEGRRRRTRRRRREKRKPRENAQEEAEEEAKDNPEDERSHAHEEQEDGQKKEELKAMISKLLNSQERKEWTLQETDLLLELVEKHQQDWSTIHEKMKKQGFCRNMPTEDLILYFLSLPRRGVIKLQEEYDDDQFLEANFNSHRTSIFDRIAEKKLNDAVAFTAHAPPDLLAALKAQAAHRDYPWRAQLDQMLRLQVRKYEQRLEHLQNCETLVKGLRVFNEKQ